MPAPTAFAAPAARSGRFLLVHAALIPGVIALAAVLARGLGIDHRIEAVFFDPMLAGFPARQWPLLEIVGHHVAKSAVFGLWFLLAGGAIAAAFVDRLRAYRGLLWTTAAAMALGPVIVVVLKNFSAYRCPWDLAEFGGVAHASSGWLVSSAEAGRCFPGGHASGGFSLVALYFAGLALRHAGLRRSGLIAALGAGIVFSLVRMAQGAHFLSHNLWAAAIDWCAAALVFAPALLRAQPSMPAAVGAKPGAAAGLRRIVLAGGYSLQGLRAVWRREAAFRQEAAAAALLVPLALSLPVSAYEKAALSGGLLFVLVVELLNSALEAVVDLVSPGRHPLAGMAKDAGSAAVLLALILAAGVWIVVLGGLL